LQDGPNSIDHAAKRQVNNTHEQIISGFGLLQAQLEGTIESRKRFRFFVR
jgi:hypothetical protein